ncbi:MAG: methylmalonyl Co-A mutase-associated GTPase MeaB, partial [Ilumatobacteraceae bacterium]
APGAGKSTLTSALVDVVRHRGQRVAVLAIDPSSPFTGGAILGDRVRMQQHATDDGVFIRSMATRGHLGGLSIAAPQAVRVLAAAGWPWVFVETVGVGQVEVEVAGNADTTVVVVNPGWGDSVQAAKAGLLEIADVFVINKADREGARQTHRDLQRTIDMSDRAGGGWRPPIVDTIATDTSSATSGVDEVWDAISAHRAMLETSGELAGRRAVRRSDELRRIVLARLEERARQAATAERWAGVEADVAAGRIDPWSAADALLGPP